MVIELVVFNGSKNSRSTPVGRPKAVDTAAEASLAVTAPALATKYSSTKVVSGLITLEPSGAINVKVLGRPVSILTPPEAMTVPVTPSGIIKAPLASVVPKTTSTPAV